MVVLTSGRCTRGRLARCRLVPLAFFGFLLFLSQWSSSNVDNGGVVAYCIVVALWATTFLEFW